MKTKYLIDGDGIHAGVRVKVIKSVWHGVLLVVVIGLWFAIFASAYQQLH